MTAPRERPPHGLCLRLHGEPVLALPGGRQVALEPRAAALLALAALEPGLTRLRAARLLWPDSLDPRRNLRQQLLRFRRQFDRELLTGDDTLALADGIVVEPGDQPLLGGLAYDDNEDFAAWLAQRRREAQAAQVGAARQRLAAAEAAGDLEAALRVADELIAIDRHDEAHHRESMRLHYLAGNVAAGLKAYERLDRMLAVEFGTRPSTTTEQMAETLRRARQDGAARTPLALAQRQLPLTLKRPPSMAGRGAELGSVRRALDDGLVVWLEGEAGLGKSRLLAEVLAAAPPDGPILLGAGRPGDAGAPYATLARWLRPWLGDGADASGPEPSSALRHLAPTPAGDDAPAAPALAPGELEAAVADLLRRRGSALLVLDDLHFADGATIELVAGLAARNDLPTRWIVACRPAEVPPAGQGLRHALIELQRLAVVALAPLTAGDLAVLVDALGIDGLHGSELAAPLLRHTGGNPLFVLETMKQGLHDGSLARGELPRPGTVAQLIGLRLARLSEGALTLARIAAIAGVDFSIELAEATTGARAVQLASAWQELQDAQILRDEAFAHDLVADTVLRGVPQVVARRVHAQCAAWLARQGGEPLRLARHWLAGGQPAQAALAFEAAARRAGQASRVTEEAGLWSDAADAHAAAGQAAPRFEALAQRVTALREVALDDAAVAEAKALLTHATSDLQRARAHRVWISLATQFGQMHEVLDGSAQALALARRIGATDELVRMACDVAGNQCKAGRPDDGLALLSPMREWVDRQADDEVRGLWYGHFGAALSHVGRLREAVVHLQEATAATARTGRSDAEGAIVGNLAIVYRTMGRLGDARACSMRSLELRADDPNETAARTLSRLVHARDLAETGEFAEALRLFDDVLPRFEAMGSAFWTCAARTSLATLWLHLGQLARAQQALQADESQAPDWMRSGRGLLRMEIAAFAAQPVPLDEVRRAVDLMAGDAHRLPGTEVRALRAAAPAEVLANAERLAEPLRRHERFGALLALRTHESRAALLQGDAGHAARAARHALELIDEGYGAEFMYAVEPHWAAFGALTAAGDLHRARHVLEAGARWVQRRALPHVPPPFIDSFLHRNPVNRELLAAASR